MVLTREVSKPEMTVEFLTQKVSAPEDGGVGAHAVEREAGVRVLRLEVGHPDGDVAAVALVK